MSSAGFQGQVARSDGEPFLLLVGTEAIGLSPRLIIALRYPSGQTEEEKV